MITTAQPAQFDVGFVPARALSSITARQAEITAQTVHTSGRPWHVHAFDDYDGYLSLLIERIANNDEQTAFFVSGTAQCLDLFQTNNDDLFLAIASFTNASDLSTSLLDLIDRNDADRSSQV